MQQIDETKLNELVGRVLGDLGGAVSVPLVRMGDALGLYKALKESGPTTANRLASATGCAPSARSTRCTESSASSNAISGRCQRP